MKSGILHALAFLFLLTVPLRPGLAADPQQLFASDGAAQDQFGHAVENARNLIVVGAPYADIEGASDQGAAYVYVRRGHHWEQAAKLVAADGTAGDNFGWDVDTDGHRIVIGALRATLDGLSQAGAAYVFERRGQDWQQTTKLTSTNPEENEYFGNSVAISDGRVAVGALYTTTAFGPLNGSVYLFQQDRPDGWLFEQRFDSGLDEPYGMYGTDVDLADDALIVGMRNWGGAEGAAYFYNVHDGEWRLWWSMMPGHNPTCCRYGGKDVAVDDDVALFSAPGDYLPDAVYRSGLVYAHNRTREGFEPIQFLEPSTPHYNGEFGSVMAYGSGIIAATNPMSRQVLLFTKDKDGTWIERTEVDVMYPYNSLEHGMSVGEGVLAIGEPRWNVGDNIRQGHVLVYDLKDVL